jgi:two-component system sensor histidine kinase UhpB
MARSGPVGEGDGVRPTNSSLYWKVCLINGAVLCAGTLALVVSPARVSRDVVLSEVVVIAVGLAVMLAANAVLLRSALAPVDRVIREMATAQLGGPPATSGRRPEAQGAGAGARLLRSYDAMLDRLEAERSASNAKALAAQEAERHRIAQELHDQAGQSLTVVLLGLKQLSDRAPAELVAELDLIRETARSGLDDVRRVARELRPGVLHDLGLQAALAALATDVSAHGGPLVRRTFGPGLPALSADAELVVYRVAQEALTNVLRHAGARRVELSLLRVGGDVVLEVSDDGRGLDGPPPAGTGIAGMTDRALLVDGTVTFESRPGRGTTVRLRVPVREDGTHGVDGGGE